VSLMDRMLRRSIYPGSYSEAYYTGAEYAPGYAADGGRKEQADQAIVRQSRRAYKDNGIVAAVMIARQHLLAEARFQFQAAIDGHLFGNTDLHLLEHPWPNGQTGDLLARMCVDGSMGNSYIRKAVPSGGGDPVLVRVPQEKVTIVSEELADDQGRVWKGQRLGDMPRRREQLPQQFDPVTNQTIELIDELWLDGNAIVAAFEIESTTSIYSGLLRMSDLVARQPNISVPLFLVAPDERREKVIQQVNRPTFERMKPPLVEVCRYISFEGLREALTAAHDYVSFLKPAWLQTVSESCALEDL